tara:strand:- start:900 stop:4601 length:3702 start_codon:yes stop_codon:yes gene_type:complete
MADSHKNIVITPNNNVATSLPNIVFTGYENDPMTMNVTDGVSGGNKGIDITGSEGQVFNITPELNTGSFFRANDISGLPAIEAKSDGKLIFNQFNQGNVGIGTDSPSNTYQGLEIYGTNPSLRLKGSGASSWNWIEFVTSSGTNNFSLGVNQTIPYFGIKAGAGMDSPDFRIDSNGRMAVNGDVSSTGGGQTARFHINNGAGEYGIKFIGSAAGTVNLLYADHSDIASGSEYAFSAKLNSNDFSIGNHGQIKFDAWGSDTVFQGAGTSNLTILGGGNQKHHGNRILDSQTVNDLQGGASYRFDGVDDGVDASTIMSDGFTSYSIEAIFKCTESPVAGLDMITGFKSGHYWWMGRDSNNKLHAQHRDTSNNYRSNVSSSTITLGEWQHAVWTVVKGGQHLYLNGVLEASSSFTGELSSGDFAAYIGRYSSGDYFTGEIAKVRYHNRVLSASDVAAAYNGQSVPFEYTGASGGELITNGAFATDSDWTKGTGWTISGGTASCDGSQTGYSSLVQTKTISIGQSYRLKLDLTRSAGSVNVWIGGNQNLGNIATTVTGQTYEFVATYSGNVQFEGSSDFSGSIDNVSLTRIGCIAEYLPQSIGGAVWLDTSGNSLSGTVTNGAVQTNNPGIFGGNVGIGTATPYANLDVRNTGAGDGTFLFSVRGSNAGRQLQMSNLLVGSDNDRVGIYWENQGVANTRMWVGDDGYLRDKISNPTSANDGRRYIREDDAGNVGIGETSPLGLLHLKGSNTLAYYEESDASANNKIWKLGAQSEDFVGKIVLDNDTGGNNWLEVKRTTNTVDSVSFPNGNVGIGTVAPSQTLHVAGDVKADYLLSTKTINASNNDSVSYKFDGVNDYVIVDDSSQTWHGEDWTYSLWVKTLPSLQQWAQLIELKHDAGANVNNHTGIFLNLDGTISCSVYQTTGTSKSITQTNTINDGEWHHLAWSHENTTTNGNVFYIDGVKVNSDTTSLTLSDTYRRMYIGINRNDADNAFNSPFDGQISRVRVFNNALTDDEIKQLYSGASVDYKYVGSNQTDFVVNGTMESALTTGWNVESGLTMTQSSTTRSGGGDSYSANIYGSTASGEEFYQNMTGLTVGKRYRVSAWVFNNSGTQFFSRETYSYAAGYGVSDHAHINLPSNNAWTFYEAEFTSANALAQYSFYLSGTVTTGQLLIDDVSITQIGCVAEYLPDGITSSEWTDSSGNDLDGTVTGAVVSGINPIADLASNAMNIAMAVALG